MAKEKRETAGDDAERKFIPLLELVNRLMISCGRKDWKRVERIAKEIEKQAAIVGRVLDKEKKAPPDDPPLQPSPHTGG